MYQRTIRVERQKDNSYSIDDKHVILICRTPEDVCKVFGNKIAPMLLPLLSAGKDIKITITDETD